MSPSPDSGREPLPDEPSTEVTLHRTHENGASFRVDMKSEFASVRVGLDRSANGVRLEITDRITGRTCYFDLLEIECLTRMSHDVLDRYLPHEED